MMPNELAKEIQSALQRFGLAQPWQKHPLVGDASSRIYSRIRNNAGESLILMEFGQGPQSLAEEKTPGSLTELTEPPFVNIAKHLSRFKVNVPKIIACGPGYILLEDLGDLTVYDWIHKQSPDEKAIRKVTQAALVELSKIHLSRASSASECIAVSRRFDATLYFWEFVHFIDYGLNWLLKNKKTYKNLRNYFGKISEQLAKLPVCITHRDFHSKNLMLKGDPISGQSVWVLDFQDAIMAPCHYDLASLLFDSYTDLPSHLIDELTAHYFKMMPESLTGGSYDSFCHELRLVALHRNLKAAGRFLYIYAEKKKSTHLPYVLPTLRKVESHFKYLQATDEFMKELPLAEIEKAMNALV